MSRPYLQGLGCTKNLTPIYLYLIFELEMVHINQPQSLDPFGSISVYSWFKKPLSILHSGLEFEW